MANGVAACSFPLMELACCQDARFGLWLATESEVRSAAAWGEKLVALSTLLIFPRLGPQKKMANVYATDASKSVSTRLPLAYFLSRVEKEILFFAKFTCLTSLLWELRFFCVQSPTFLCKRLVVILPQMSSNFGSCYWFLFVLNPGGVEYWTMLISV